MKYLTAIFALILLVMSRCNNYENNGNAVYYNSWNEGTGSHKYILKGVDPKKFHILKFSSYAKDNRLVFYNGDTVKGADAKTFEALGDFFAHDKYRGYYAADSIKSSKGVNFRMINDYYTTDGQDVFFMTDPLKVVSVKNFRFVYDSGEDEWERWTTDGKFYYIKNYKIPSNDYANMILYKKSGGLSKDKRYVYFQDHKLNFDYNTGKRIIDTVDVNTFKVTNYLECSDKYSCINPFHGREKCKVSN